MRRIISTLALAAIAKGTRVHGLAQDFERHCSSATIKGNDAFRVSGEVFTGARLVYRDGIALTHFDGINPSLKWTTCWRMANRSRVRPTPTASIPTKPARIP
jgi:hypothetical protein